MSFRFLANGHRSSITVPAASALLSLSLTACGGSDGGDIPPSLGTSEPVLIPGAIRGEITSTGSKITSSNSLVNRSFEKFRITLDARAREHRVDANGAFLVDGVPDGDHSLFIHALGLDSIEVPCRLLEGRGLDLGTLTLRGGRVVGRTGFDGYRFGFVDEDRNGFHDHFADADGDGICDPGMAYAGYPYLMSRGFVDADGDGINDRWVDINGDGYDDLDRGPLGGGFGWEDANGDGINDHFVDADGDGICDLTGMPFRHPFGYGDADGDGINDRFFDADGDGINDVDNRPYMAMPGWVDADGNGMNDFFADADGDGLNDLFAMSMGYGHGFGFVDEDGDGLNDHFADADGNGVNDRNQGPLAAMPFTYGFAGAHVDGDGDGIDDNNQRPYAHGFGWVDQNGDGVNDAYTDADGNGVNDCTGRCYTEGYAPRSGASGQRCPSHWPMEAPDRSGDPRRGGEVGPGPGMGMPGR